MSGPDIEYLKEELRHFKEMKRSVSHHSANIGAVMELFKIVLDQEERIRNIERIIDLEK